MAVTLARCDKAMEDNFPSEYASVVHFKQQVGETEININLLNVEDVVSHTVSIGKGGNNPSATANVSIDLLSEVEMEEYNTNFNTSYKILPAKYYRISDKEVVFAANESKKTLEVSFEVTLMKKELPPEDTYVLPLRLNSGTSKVNDQLNTLIIKPNVITPVVNLDMPAVQSVEMSVNNSQQTNFTTALTAYVDLEENKWNFSATFERDQSALEGLVNQYNAEVNGRNFILLPSKYYTLPTELVFPLGKVLVGGSVNIDRGDLPIGNYLLPIKLKSVVGRSFDVDPRVAYIEVRINSFLPEFKLTESMLSGTRDEMGPNFGQVPRYKRYMLDGNVSSYWQSEWTVYTTPGDVQKPHDPKYGLYLDIALPNEIQAMSFDLKAVAQTAANPVHAQVYVGNDKNSLTANPVMDLNSGFSTNGADVWYKSPQYRSPNKFKYIRIAFIKNGEGRDLRQKLNSSVIVSELKLFGQ